MMHLGPPSLASRRVRVVAWWFLMASTVPAFAAPPVCTRDFVGDRDFFGISGSSDGNVVGVGADGRVWHYDGNGWQSMFTWTNDDLNDVEVVDDDLAFAVGDDGTVLQRFGNFWFGHNGVTGRDLFGVWADSTGEAWVVGDFGEIGYYDGSSWDDVSDDAGTNNRDMEDVWGDAGRVYVMSDRGELYVYDRNSGTWTEDDECQGGGNDFRDLWGDGQGNLYMVRGDDVYVHDGASCQHVVDADEDLYGIYGSPDGQIYAGGADGAVLYYDGSTWVEQTETNEDINDVWVSPTGTAYFGADDEEILSCTVPQPNLVADWPLDDCTLGFNGSDVVDSGPNGLDGVTVGGVEVTNDGSLCSAAGFNGSNAYVSVPDSPALDLDDGLSVAVWVRHNGGPLKAWESILAKGDSAYRLHLNGGCEIADSLPGNVARGITFGLNGGCAGADLNSNVVPSPGVWYHVAASYDGSVMRIYIDGSLVNSADYDEQIDTNGFDLYIGENPQQRGRYWNGDIDELTLWDQAISAQAIATHMNRTRPCTACAAAEFVITHDNYGIHCVDETVEIEVVDGVAGTPRTDYDAEVTLDTQTGNGTWVLVNGSGVFDDGAADDGLATYVWALGEDSATFALQYRQGTPSFDIDVYQTSDSGIRDTDVEGQMTFAASGYTVTAGPLANPPPPVIAPFAAPQVAAVEFPVHIAAYGQTPNDPECGVIESYDGGRDLQVWFDHVDPVNGTIAPTVDGAPAGPSEAAAGTRTINFVNGQAVVAARYKDAGRIQLFFNDDDVGDPDQPDGIRGATAPFVVKPYTFELSGIADAGGVPNPAAADASGPAFLAAGEPFSATVTALDADGDPTPNYGREIVPETVGLDANLVSPAGGNNPAITSAAGFGAFAVGQATGSDFTWPEVGIVTLTPRVGDGSYLGAGDVVGNDSGNVGRFHPHHFTTAQNVPSFATACSTGSFTYIGQAFDYAASPVVTATARASDGSVTANYEGAYFRIDNGALLNRSYTSASGTLDTSGLPPPAVDPVVQDQGNGVATLTFGAGSGLEYLKGAPEAPFDAEIALAIEVFDSDGVAALANPVSFGAGGGILFQAGAEMRYGRIRLTNSIGSELVDLNVPMHAEYFAGAGTGFVRNVDDACTANVTLALGAFTNNLDPGDTCAIENGSPGLSGIGCAAAGPAGQRYREPPLGADFNLYLRAPGAGDDGSATVTADVPAWLRFDWDASAAGEENPAGTATFGIYRGEDRRIYTRELY